MDADAGDFLKTPGKDSPYPLSEPRLDAILRWDEAPLSARVVRRWVALAQLAGTTADEMSLPGADHEACLTRWLERAWIAAYDYKLPGRLLSRAIATRPELAQCAEVSGNLLRAPIYAVAARHSRFAKFTLFHVRGGLRDGAPLPMALVDPRHASNFARASGLPAISALWNELRAMGEASAKLGFAEGAELALNFAGDPADNAAFLANDGPLGMRKARSAVDLFEFGEREAWMERLAEAFLELGSRGLARQALARHMERALSNRRQSDTDVHDWLDSGTPFLSVDARFPEALDAHLAAFLLGDATGAVAALTKASDGAERERALEDAMHVGKIAAAEFNARADDFHFEAGWAMELASAAERALLNQAATARPAPKAKARPGL